MHSILTDVRYALRSLRRTPGFAVVSVITLMLAIGMTTALFSVINSVVLEPLPYYRSDRLVYLASTSPTGKPMPVSPQNLIDYRDKTGVFEDVAAIDAGESATLTRPTAPAARLNEARVGADFFRILGVTPAAGRFIAPGEDSTAAPKVVVLSALAWSRYFGGDPSIVGRSILLDGEPYRVVGVARRGLDFPQHPDIWIPAVWRTFELGDAARGYNAVAAVARLKDGVTIERATRELQGVAGDLARRFPEYNAGVGAYIDPLQHQLVGSVTRALWPMLGAVLFVLLIACVNVANLLMVRASARESEIAVRTALGAGRRRIIRQLVTESMLIWLAGTTLGVFLAWWALDIVVLLEPAGLPRLNDISMDGRALAFAALVMIVTGIGFGLIPAIGSTKSEIANMLRRSGRHGSGASSRTRAALIVSEVALATVLLVGAGLLARSFEQLMHADPGFRADRLLTFDVALTGGRYRHDADNNAFANSVETRLAALPGVKSAAVAAERPLDPDGPYGASTSFTVDNEPKPRPGTEPNARLIPVSPKYFQTIGATLVRGRFIDQRDNRLDAPPVILVDEELARRYFPGVDPMGKRLTFGLSHSTTGQAADTVRMRGQVVGILRNLVRDRLGEKPEPTAYFPYATAPFGSTFVVRTAAEPTVVEPEIRRVVASVDPDVSVYELGTMDDAMAASVAQPRFYALLLGSFSIVALLLAGIGIFGVVSYAVGQRTREFGIRFALGATARDVTRSVVSHTFTLVSGGIIVGGVLAMAATGTIRALLYGVQPLDATAFVAAMAILAGVALLAAWLPARRAARIDPMVAMRPE